MNKLNHIIIFLLALSTLLACTKDYSYEGGANYVPRRDTLPPVGNGNPGPVVCAACIGNDVFIENKWSLKVGGFLYCGVIDSFIATPSRIGFTVYGPSACSIDSGMVITANLQTESLTHNITNFTSDKNGFYYYDRVLPSYIAITQPGNPFYLRVDSYDHTTKMLTCSFYGYAQTHTGGSIYVSEGKFKIKAL